MDGMTGSDIGPIRFRFAPRKVLAAVHWMLAERKTLDLHAILKTCYFADKEHLNRYGRPIFGARYQAMRYGPVPLEIYEMLKAEPYWLAELARDTMPWKLSGYRVALQEGVNAEPPLEELSDSDMECLRSALEKSAGMTFDQRTAATHGPDWQRARLGRMRYEDMISDDHPERERLIAELQRNAAWIDL